MFQTVVDELSDDFQTFSRGNVPNACESILAIIITILFDFCTDPWLNQRTATDHDSIHNAVCEMAVKRLSLYSP